MFHEYFNRYFAQLAGLYSAYSNKIHIGRGWTNLFLVIVIVGDCWFHSIECGRAVLVLKERQKVEYVKKIFRSFLSARNAKNVHSQNTAFAEG